MKTLHDWISVAIFCGLAVLFLQRSAGRGIARDHPLLYLPAALGCVAIDMLGNAGHLVAAATALIATILYIVVVLRPQRGW
ncbi:hypothetical protein EAH87_14775 [Sphingomonas koreensis]|nr:hypothetical protein EAH87_14775 [Sphingomonas koreensis]